MQHEHHRVPVTALACWRDNVILAGSGPYLQAYNVTTKTLLTSIRVFEDQAIHGIVTGGTNDEAAVLIWGGQSMQKVRLRFDEMGSLTSRQLEKVANAKDWILDAAGCPENEHKFAYITAHNSLSIASADGNSTCLALHEIVSGSNCILYCAQVTWLSPSSCLIASGTAFGDIIVWSCHLDEHDNRIKGNHQVHYSYPAHEGSVFGVQISTPGFAERGCGQQRLLASCSDDRSIRVWDITDLSRDNVTNGEEQTETGFGALPSTSATSPPCIASTLGHISRIWHVRFTKSDKAMRLLSFGEDATCITWALSAVGQSAVQLKQLAAYKAHTGKNIWSVCIHNVPQIGSGDVRTTRVVTGGADGAIGLVTINEHDSASPQRHQVCEPSKARYRSYGFVSSCDVVATTDEGDITLLKLNAAQSALHSQPLGQPSAQLRGYSTIATSEGVAFFAGKGEIYYYVFGDTAYHVLVDIGEKVAALFVQAEAYEHNARPKGRSSLLATTVKSRSALLHECHQDDDFGIAVTSAWSLEMPAAFVVTSFVQFDQNDNMLVALGSRNGNIAIYRLDRSAAEPRPVCCISLSNAVHGVEAITALRVHNGALLSTGRDGTLAAHTIHLVCAKSASHALPTTALTTLHQLALPLGPNVEDVVVKENGEIWAWGFRSKQFVVFNISTQQEVMVVECGGAHRNFAFAPGSEGGSLVWTKASELYVQHQQRFPCTLINSGGHGREIKCSVVSPTNSSLVATGAEDTDIKIHLYTDGAWRCLHTLQKHITGIQHLQWSSNGTHLFSSGGVEEFYIWRMSHHVPGLGLGVVCESAHPRCNLSDLRIMSFEVADGVGSGHDITMVYSDSTIRRWRYGARTWTLSCSGDYLTSCLTQCLRLTAGNAGQENSAQRPRDSRLVTASTDGHIVWWNADDSDEHSLTWHTRHKVHQSAVLSLIAQKLPSSAAGGEYLLISGGDDNAIGLTRLSLLQDSAAAPAMSTLLVPRAHAAAVTALAIVHHSVGCIWLASASIDQRIKLWRISIGPGSGVDGVEIALGKNVCTAVADVAAMELVGEDRLLICGVGMDLWRVDFDGLRAELDGKLAGMAA